MGSKVSGCRGPSALRGPGSKAVKSTCCWSKIGLCTCIFGEMLNSPRWPEHWCTTTCAQISCYKGLICKFVKTRDCLFTNVQRLLPRMWQSRFGVDCSDLFTLLYRAAIYPVNPLPRRLFCNLFSDLEIKNLNILVSAIYQMFYYYLFLSNLCLFVLVF